MSTSHHRAKPPCAVVALPIGTWEPVLQSLIEVMDPAPFDHFYPGRRAAPAQSVEAVCTSGDYHVWTI